VHAEALKANRYLKRAKVPAAPVAALHKETRPSESLR
jgi:hypothetical protein